MIDRAGLKITMKMSCTNVNTTKYHWLPISCSPSTNLFTNFNKLLMLLSTPAETACLSLTARQKCSYFLNIQIFKTFKCLWPNLISYFRYKIIIWLHKLKTDNTFEKWWQLNPYSMWILTMSMYILFFTNIFFKFVI